jgi:hypothetical protein
LHSGPSNAPKLVPGHGNASKLMQKNTHGSS